MDMNWASVEQINNFRVILENGQPAGEIYGNGLNCVAVFISFLALSAQGVVDLQGVNLTSAVHLTDYVTGSILPYSAKENASLLEQPGLYYSSSRSKFCEPLPSTLNSIDVPGEDPNLGRGSIKYYLYGKSKVDIRRQVGVVIKLHRRLIYIDKTRSLSHKLDILLRKPKKYTKNDLESSWYPVWSNSSISQDNLFVGLKDNIGTGWIDYEFLKCPQYTNENLCTGYGGPFGENSYLYLYSPIGEQINTTLLMLSQSQQERFTYPLIYNQEPESFCLVRLKESGSTFLSLNGSEASVRLYDEYGNSGHFKFDFSNPESPEIKTQNF